MQNDEAKTKEEMLQELKEYRAIFEICGSSIAIVEEDTTISMVNKEFVALFGYTKEEVEGKIKLTALCAAEEKDRINYYHRQRRIDPASVPQNYEARFIHKNGGFIDTHVSASLIPNTRKSVLATINITERKKAEEALRRSHEELESRVKERTAELEKLNQVLLAEIEERMRAEMSVVKERERLDNVLELLPAYLILLTPDYQVTLANRFFRERFGESRGRRCFEYLFGRSEPCENCESMEVLKTLAPHEWYWTGPDGRYYHIYDFPFTDTDGSTLIMEMGIDITEQKMVEESLQKAHDILEARVAERTAELNIELTQRKQAEEAFREANAYLENLLNYANAPIIVWDPDYRIIRFNHAFERLTGYSAGEVLGKSLEILFPAAQKDESMALIRRTTSGERFEVVEIAIARVDGTVRTVLWNSATLFADDGVTVVATIAQGQDITERKQAEEAFREANAYLENLLNYANAPIIVWDPDYKIIRFNQAFERLTGYSAGEVLGKSLEILFPAAQKDESMALIRRTTSGERFEVVEIAIARVDGTVRTVLWNSATLFADDGVTVVATIAQGQDITERKQAEEALRKSHEELDLRVKERTEELEKLNQALRAEIEERKRAEEIISRQAQEILEVSTPVIQIWKGIVSVPLIGTLDSMRAEQLMEQLLQRIVETGSTVALLDVTGVPAIDSKTARHLLETISAVRLLGAEVVLTGIRPAIARTLAQLGVDLSNVNTRSSFSAGLSYAFTLLKMRVVSQASAGSSFVNS
jgi:anti-anti-sigma factor